MNKSEIDYKYDFAVLIGRFQPFHKGHNYIVKKALEHSKHLIILIGSADQPRTPKNPWTVQERAEMIQLSTQDYSDRISIGSVRDQVNDQKWITIVQDAVKQVTVSRTWTDKHRIAIIGHEKDETSYYIKMFPQWNLVDVGSFEGINATDVRNFVFATNNIEQNPSWQEQVEFPVVDYINNWKKTDHFDYILEEQKFVNNFKFSWRGSPYPPIFVTVDSCVIQSGHILLVRRKSFPGKGTYALPGGYIKDNERLVDSALRELREETKLKVPEPVIRGSLKHTSVFDNPSRSLRGRVITHCFLFELPHTNLPLPKVKGSDDAEKAFWFPLSDLYGISDRMFEDHYLIVQSMVDKL